MHETPDKIRQCDSTVHAVAFGYDDVCDERHMRLCVYMYSIRYLRMYLPRGAARPRAPARARAGTVRVVYLYVEAKSSI